MPTKRFPQQRVQEQDALLQKKADETVSDDEYKKARTEYQKKWKHLDDADNASQKNDDD